MAKQTAVNRYFIVRYHSLLVSFMINFEFQAGIIDSEMELIHRLSRQREALEIHN